MSILDFDSVILTSFGLAIMMVMVLRVVGAHVHRTLVLRWMHAWLLIAFALLLYLAQSKLPTFPSLSLLRVNVIAVICVALSFYVNGIRRARGYRVHRYLPLLVFSMLLSMSAFILNSHASLHYSLVMHGFVLVGIFAYGSKSLMGRENNFINQIFWLCSSMFAAITLLLFTLSMAILLTAGAVLQDFQYWHVDAYLVVLLLMVLISVTFLLVLILQVNTHDSLQAIATLDGLTGVLNRRGLQDAALKMQSVSRRLKIPMALVLIDLDFFKKVNDVYGHLVGDIALKSVANTIRASLRGGDVIGRYGGEEFCLLLPNTKETEAEVLAERIRQTIAATPIEIEAFESLRKVKAAIKCTVSIGCVSSETADYDIDKLFTTADHNLYQAKQAGRNRVKSNAFSMPAAEESLLEKRRSGIIKPDA